MSAEAELLARTRPPYAMVPEAMLMGPHAVSGDAVRLYAILDRRIDNRDGSTTHGLAFPGRQWLAEKMGVSVRKVADLLAELKAAGWLTAGRRGHGRTNVYLLHERPQMGTNVQVTPDVQNPAHLDVQGGAHLDVQGNAVHNESKKNESKKQPPGSPPSAPPCQPTDLFGQKASRRSAPGAKKRTDDGFAAFWARYPSAGATEVETRRLYESATRRASQAQILEGLDRWVAYWAEHGYPWSPVRWLKGDAWASPVPARESARVDPPRPAAPPQYDPATDPANPENWPEEERNIGPHELAYQIFEATGGKAGRRRPVKETA